jgi:hypothetical protein
MDTLIDLKTCECITIVIEGKNHLIKLAGTIYDPYFCGRDVCKILGYREPKKALQKYVCYENKKILRIINRSSQIMVESTYNLGKQNFTYREGQTLYIDEKGLYSLFEGCKLHKNKKELKTQMEKWIVQLKYGQNSGLIDIFSFVKRYNLTFDIESDWFQDLWYPLSQSKSSLQGGLTNGENLPEIVTTQNLWYPLTKFQPPLQGGLTMVENRPIIVTQNLLNWMGYKGRNLSDKQDNFCKTLRSLNIPYEEIDYTHPLALEYPCVQKEMKLIPKNNLERKKWICMDQRSFKKAVMRLNTENAEVVRDYYLNLEEAMFAYGEYTMKYLIEKTERTRKLKEEKLLDLLTLKETQLAIKEKSEEELQIQLEQETEARIKAERKAIRVNKFMRRVTIKERKLEWIYIATTSMYALERIFKIGSTSRLSSRIGGYNTGRPVEDTYYYCWVTKCYNSKDIDYHIQKLLVDFKHRDNSELYCGIKFTDLKDIVNFIVENYDASIDYINNFIKTRLNESLEEEDQLPPRLDCKSITYQIGEHTETIDVEKEDLSTIRDELDNILTTVKEQQRQSEEIVVDRKELVTRLSHVTNTPKKDLWYRIKELTGWINSKTDIEDGLFKYKIVY